MSLRKILKQGFLIINLSPSGPGGFMYSELEKEELKNFMDDLHSFLIKVNQADSNKPESFKIFKKENRIEFAMLQKDLKTLYSLTLI